MDSTVIPTSSQGFTLAEVDDDDAESAGFCENRHTSQTSLGRGSTRWPIQISVS